MFSRSADTALVRVQLLNAPSTGWSLCAEHDTDKQKGSLALHAARQWTEHLKSIQIYTMWGKPHKLPQHLKQVGRLKQHPACVVTMATLSGMPTVNGIHRAPCNTLLPSARSVSHKHLRSVLCFKPCSSAKQQAVRSLLRHDTCRFIEIPSRTGAAESSKSCTLKSRQIDSRLHHTVQAAAVLLVGLGLVLPEAAQAFSIHQEPANALSLPTWVIHISSVIEWVVAMALVWRYAEVTGAGTICLCDYVAQCKAQACTDLDCWRSDFAEN